MRRLRLLHILPGPLQKRRKAVMYLLLSVLLLLAGIFAHLYRVETELSVPWMPTPQDKIFASSPLPPPPPVEGFLYTSLSPPLRAKGRNVVDSQGKRFPLASVNWYGSSDELFVTGGLDVRHRSDIARTIRRLGFNSVRLPYSDEMVRTNPVVPAERVAANPDLAGRTALEVFVATAQALADQGVAVVVNNHITSATWCCGADPCDAGWENEWVPFGGWVCRVRQTEEQWVENWLAVMSYLQHTKGVIGVDLRNEVRGLWGTMPWDKWAAAAERAGNALLGMNPDWLVVVGGTESGNDLSGVAKRPVRLGRPGNESEWDDRIVYSAHVYSWSGWGSSDGRYARRGYESFVRSMRENWAYLIEGNVAPVWVGEFGAPHRPGKGDANYWRHLLHYLKDIRADFGYWAVNPRKPHNNEPETYGLVLDDWETPVLDYRLRDIRELVWRDVGDA